MIKSVEIIGISYSNPPKYYSGNMIDVLKQIHSDIGVGYAFAKWKKNELNNKGKLIDRNYPVYEELLKTSGDDSLLLAILDYYGFVLISFTKDTGEVIDCFKLDADYCKKNFR